MTQLQWKQTRYVSTCQSGQCVSVFSGLAGWYGAIGEPHFMFLCGSWEMDGSPFCVLVCMPVPRPYPRSGVRYCADYSPAKAPMASDVQLARVAAKLAAAAREAGAAASHKSSHGVGGP